MRRQLRGCTSDHPRPEAMLVAQNLCGRHLEVPNHAQPSQDPQDVICGVKLPPSKPLADAALIGVVVVVPTLSHGENCEQPVVAGFVSGQKSFAAANMCKRIDAKCYVIH